MKVYLRSRGYEQKKDYCWLEITEEDKKKQDQLSLLDEFPLLIDENQFSLILARHQSQLFLVITALDSKRKDFSHRKIVNSVALVGQGADEITLRLIAYQALKGQLSQEIDRVIKFGDSSGFTIELLHNQQLKTQLIQKLIANTEANSLEPNQTRKVGNNSPKLKEELAAEIRQFSLPSDDSVLIVVSTIASKESLEKFKVWRGLSNQIREDYWQEINSESPNGSKLKKIIPLLGIGTIIIFTSIFLFVLPFKEVVQSINPFYRSTPTPTQTIASSPNPSHSNSSTPVTSPSPAPLSLDCKPEINDKSVLLTVSHPDLKGKTVYVEMWRQGRAYDTHSQEASDNIIKFDGANEGIDGKGSTLKGATYHIVASLEKLPDKNDPKGNAAKQAANEPNSIYKSINNENCYVFISR